MAGPPAELLKSEHSATLRGYQVGAIFTPYMAIKRGGSGVQTFDWTRSIQELVMYMDACSR